MALRNVYKLCNIATVNKLVYLPSVQMVCRYCDQKSQEFPTTCPGVNYIKGSEEVALKPDSEYPDWLWTLGGAKRDIKDMSPEVDGKAYYKRLRKMKIREQNMIRKQRKF